MKTCFITSFYNSSNSITYVDSQKSYDTFEEIPALTISEIKSVIDLILDDLVAVESQGLFIWGPPGVGKSALVKQIAKEKELELRDIRLPLIDPVDLRGLPIIDKEAKQAVWLPPDFLPDKDAPPGILFLDEINAAPPSVQASAYQLVLDRCVGNYKLPEGWAIIAAGNRTTDRSVAYRLPTALANRFTHLEVRVDFEEWSRWAIEKNIDPYIISFLLFNSQLLLAFDPKSNKTAFATPRSWEFASKLQKIRAENMNLYIKSVEGTIGTAVAQQFLAFLNYRDELPDPKKLLEGEPQQIPEAIDARYVLLGGILRELRHLHKDKHITYLMAYAASYEDTEFSDHSIIIVTEALKLLKTLKIEPVMVKNTEFQAWLKRNAEIIVEDSSILFD